MAEKLKVFKNVVNQVATDPISTINVLTNTETEQAVLSNVEVSASDPYYPCTIVLTMDGIPLIPIENDSIDVSGKQIVDNSSSIDVVINTGEDKSHLISEYQTKMDAVHFDGQSNSYTIKDTSTDDRTIMSAIPYTDIVPDIVSTVFSGVSDAYSAFGWIDNGVKKYSRCYSNIIYTHDSTGSLIQTSSSFGVAVYGACTDGTYFYGKSSNVDNILYRINTIDGSLASSITMSESFAGQGANQSSYLLYFDGYVYSRSTPNSTTVYKVNVITGEVTTLAVTAGGAYSAGGIITVTPDVNSIANTNAYLVEHCTANTFVIDLSTFAVVPITWAVGDPFGTSTEYGNLALEVSAGVVAFFYNAYHLFFDVNTMTRSNIINNSTSNFPTMYSNAIASSIANIPLYLANRVVTNREITYNLYADGVKITGV